MVRPLLLLGDQPQATRGRRVPPPHKRNRVQRRPVPYTRPDERPREQRHERPTVVRLVLRVQQLEATPVRGGEAVHQDAVDGGVGGGRDEDGPVVFGDDAGLVGAPPHAGRLDVELALGGGAEEGEEGWGCEVAVDEQGW